MRKLLLLSAIAAGALLAGCAQQGDAAMMDPKCTNLSDEAFMKAVEIGDCDLDVTTAAGGNPEKSFEPHEGEDHGGDKDPGDDPDPKPDPDPDPEPGNDPTRDPSTAPKF